MPEDSSERGAARVPAPAVATGPTVRLPVAVLVVVATLVLALLAIWGTTVVDADRLPTGPALDPPVPAPDLLGVDDQRQVSYQELKVTLAGSPFDCADTPRAEAPAFTSFLACTTTVHRDYDAVGDDWAAATGVAVLDDSVAGGGPQEKAKSAFDALVTLSFAAADHPRVTQRESSEAQIPAPAGAAATYEARVNVSRKGLATTYDKIVVIVVRLQSGRYAMFFSDFPHDGSKEALAAVVASVGTLSARA